MDEYRQVGYYKRDQGGASAYPPQLDGITTQTREESAGGHGQVGRTGEDCAGD